MSPYLQSMRVSPQTLAAAGIYFDNTPQKKIAQRGPAPDPHLTKAVLEYAEIYKHGKPKNGTLKDIAAKYRVPTSSISARFMRMCLK